MAKKQKQPSVKEHIEAKVCETCPRIIVKVDEPKGEYFIHDGKRMCMICRATKLSKFQKDIKKSKKRMTKDLKEMNEKFDKEENERVINIAAQAQATVEAQAVPKSV